MAVTVRPARNVEPPDLGTAYWQPSDMADVVFPEPLNRRALAVDANVAYARWHRAIAEIEWLHEIIDKAETDKAVMSAGPAGEMHRSAEAMSRQVIAAARQEAGRIVIEAQARAQQLQADALERIAATNSTEPELARLPKLDVENLPGSLRRRAAYAQSIMAEVRADAQLMCEVGFEVVNALDSGTVIETPDEPTPEPVSEMAPRVSMVNNSGEERTVRAGGSYVAVSPGDTLTIDADDVTDLLRRQFAEPAYEPPRDWRPTPDVRAGKILRHDHPEHGLREGDVVPLDVMPAGVLFETLPPEEPTLPLTPALTTGELPVWTGDDDATRRDQLGEDQAVHDDHAEDVELAERAELARQDYLDDAERGDDSDES